MLGIPCYGDKVTLEYGRLFALLRINVSSGLLKYLMIANHTVDLQSVTIRLILNHCLSYYLQQLLPVSFSPTIISQCLAPHTNSLQCTMRHLTALRHINQSVIALIRRPTGCNDFQQYNAQVTQLQYMGTHSLI